MPSSSSEDFQTADKLLGILALPPQSVKLYLYIQIQQNSVSLIHWIIQILVEGEEI